MAKSSRRNRHPFEGDLKRARALGTLRLWSGFDADWSARRRKKVPLNILHVVASVPDLRTANKIIQSTDRRLSKGGSVRRIGGTGFQNAIYDERTRRWWMLTGGEKKRG